MPEGDTIHRTASVLHAALAGHVVTRFETAYAHLARVDDDGAIAGRVVERVEARGKHVLLVLSGGLVLRTHMRMHGAWHLYQQGERWRVPTRAVRIRVETTAWAALAVNVPVADFVSLERRAHHAPLARLGPDLLSDSVDATDATARVRAEGPRPIGDVLLDQRVVAGVGNVLRCEALFMARIPPDAPAGDLTFEAIAALLECTRRVARASAATGVRRTTSRLNPDAALWVYGRAGRPCRRCGTAIASRKAGADRRTLYWCPGCQA